MGARKLETYEDLIDPAAADRQRQRELRLASESGSRFLAEKDGQDTAHAAVTSKRGKFADLMDGKGQSLGGPRMDEAAAEEYQALADQTLAQLDENDRQRTEAEKRAEKRYARGSEVLHARLEDGSADPDRVALVDDVETIEGLRLVRCLVERVVQGKDGQRTTIIEVLYGRPVDLDELNPDDLAVNLERLAEAKARLAKNGDKRVAQSLEIPGWTTQRFINEFVGAVRGRNPQ